MFRARPHSNIYICYTFEKSNISLTKEKTEAIQEFWVMKGLRMVQHSGTRERFKYILNRMRDGVCFSKQEIV